MVAESSTPSDDASPLPSKPPADPQRQAPLGNEIPAKKGLFSSNSGNSDSLPASSSKDAAEESPSSSKKGLFSSKAEISGAPAVPYKVLAAEDGTPLPKKGFFSKKSASPLTKSKKKSDAKAKDSKPAESNFVARYRALCYRLVGLRLDLRAEKSELIDPLAARLKQAGMNISPGLWRSMLIFTTLIALGVVTCVALPLFAIVLQPAMWYLYAGMVIGITGLAVPGGFSFVLGSRISNRSTQLDREIPFTLSELSVMASTGMSPIDLAHRMARRERDPAMTAEFKQVVYRTDIQGKDLITALSETAKESPSENLRETFWGLANMIHQGGNLDEYLRQKSEDVLKLKRVGQKAFIERLTTYVDMYISLLLIGVLMIVVGAYMMNAFGSTALGLSANALLLVLTFGVVPLAVVMTTVLVMTAYARSE